MRKEILVSLGDSKLKEMSEVLGSKSCVRILEELAVEDLAVSDIAKRLGMRLNTCDYNVKKLVRAGLIEKSGHWWSVKGKKMSVYRVVDRKIVISPRRRVAKKFIWVLGLTGVVGIWLRSLMKPADFMMSSDNEMIMEDAVFSAAPKAAALTADAVPEVAMMAANAGVSESIVREVSSVSFWGSLASWEWFLIGAWSAIVLFFVYSLLSERRYR